MESTIIFNKDFDASSAYVMKIFKADVSTVWNYFTQARLLDQWWGPKPWKCETVSQDFKEGGIWMYTMVGPNGEKDLCMLKLNMGKLQNTEVSTG